MFCCLAIMFIALSYLERFLSHLQLYTSNRNQNKVFFFSFEIVYVLAKKCIYINSLTYKWHAAPILSMIAVNTSIMYLESFYLAVSLLILW